MFLTEQFNAIRWIEVSTNLTSLYDPEVQAVLH